MKERNGKRRVAVAPVDEFPPGARLEIKVGNRCVYFKGDLELMYRNRISLHLQKGRYSTLMKRLYLKE